ncbi:MAG: c-type cytochrome [Polyangiaceae bacterium]
MSTTAQERDTPAADGVVHEYDGILEMDNQLPRWWLYTLFGAIAFACGYWVYFHSYAMGETATTQYARQKAEANAAEAEKLMAMGEATPEMLVALSRDPKTAADGQAIFETNCVTCHGDGGKGKVGPNLTDGAWLHGHQPMDIYKTVKEGFTPKQMPAWGPKLGEAKVRQAVAYVLSIQDTNVPGGKAPQGE